MPGQARDDEIAKARDDGGDAGMTIGLSRSDTAPTEARLSRARAFSAGIRRSRFC